MDLAPLRRRAGFLVLFLLWLLVPVTGAVAWQSGKQAVYAAGGALLAALAATAAGWRDPGCVAHRITGAAATMCSISVLVWAAPDALRTDMHMAYFAALALLAGFCDLRPIVVATLITAVHHLALDLLLPLAVFPDESSGLLRVAVHAVVLLAEAGALAWAAAAIEHAASDAVAGTRAQAEQSRLEERAAAETAHHAAIAKQAHDGRIVLADRMEADLGAVSTQVAECGRQIDSAAAALTGVSRQAAAETAAAAEAAGEASSQVQAVAAAVEELSASTGEITRQVALATAIAQRAVRQAQDTDATVAGLADGAQRIGDVVRLISDIAAKTNLLALNATIEAARAGDAGRGFAVVAGEVKSLAAQTAKATGDIGQQIEGIRATTATVVGAVRGFGSVVAEVEQVATAIAGAVDQQRAAIAGSAAAAAAIATSTGQAAGAVTRAAGAVQQAADGVVALERTSAELAANGATLRERLTGAVVALKAA